MLSDVKKQYTILQRKKTALKTEFCLSSIFENVLK